ncbi:MAG: UDP-galactopyranose mutase [Lachnospiraceae bacterium]|nr:UDP-galactopyranose mutase [Lachnospiraceae bacterium]
MNYNHYDAIVVGAGLSGSVIARHLAEECNERVLIIEKRNHIGGNMYDYVNEEGILVHKYGPHTFHTKKKELFECMKKYAEWDEYKLTCGAVINGKYTPTPFNFQTIDDFYDEKNANEIKNELKRYYPSEEFVTVLELLNHESDVIREYANFLFENDYSLYTAKQWGVSPEEIDPSVLKRVPIRLNYDIGYFDDKYQYMPATKYSDFFDKLLKHENIEIELNTDALSLIKLEKNIIQIGGEEFKGRLIYTGPIDELFGFKYGKLPYRSLRFEWKNDNIKSYQDAPVVAYPQAKGYTRITEYTKLPYQCVGEKTTYAIEYSLPYKEGENKEPYYPVLTEESQKIYARYKQEAEKYTKLYLAGRLADFKYYNMDQALERALYIIKNLNGGNDGE